MGLPVRQRRVLERIEIALRASDPKLAALFAIFARLTRDEEMPRMEQMRHRALLMLAGLRLRLAGFRSRFHIRLMPRQRAVLFFPLAIALTVTSIVFAARSSSNMCTPASSAAAAKSLPGKALPTRSVPNQKICRPPMMGPLGVGR
jgi:hypothetical protein